MTPDLQIVVGSHGIDVSLKFAVESADAGAEWVEQGKRWVCLSPQLHCEVCLSQLGDHCVYELRVSNCGDRPVAIQGMSLGPDRVKWTRGLDQPHALYALHPRVTGVNDYDADEVLGLPPLAALPKDEWHALSERCAELPHLEALVLTDAWDRPSLVEGPLSQNHAHQRKRVRWTGAGQIDFESTYRFMGIRERVLAPGESIAESGFIQCLPNGDLNNALRDYLDALVASTGTRAPLNPLVDQRFFCTWNNYIYWEANQEEILPSVRKVKEKLPAVQWYLLDDGYMVSQGSSSKLERKENGERIHSLERELPWFHHCPGISFLFDGGEGVDDEKFPDGLDGFARKVKSLGMRPGIWIGMETSRYAPVAVKHPDWFIDIGHESHLLPDLSVPEVRVQMEKAFSILFHDWGFEAVKIDFVTHLTDHPKLNYRYQEKSGAELRRWLFSTVREYLPEDGFISLACWLCMGSPWIAPWVDSYRDSMDARDGNWQTVLSNVRWSILPALSGGSGQPIPDADSVSVFKGLEKQAMQTWVNYARVGGMVLEAGGDLLRWSDKEAAQVNDSLIDGQAGGRVYFADTTFWSRDGLPCASYRALDDESYILGLYNWQDHETNVSPDWVGPIGACSKFISLLTEEVLSRDDLTHYRLPARGSALFRAI